MNKFTNIFLMAVLVGSASVSFGQDSVPAALVELQTKYQEAIAPIGLTRAARLDELNADYRASIEKRQKELMAQGASDAALAFTTELDRIASGGTPDEATMPAPRLLTESRTQYWRRVKQIQTEHDKQLKEATDKYIQSLDLLEKKMTSQKDLSGALLVRAESDRVKGIRSHSSE